MKQNTPRNKYIRYSKRLIDEKLKIILNQKVKFKVSEDYGETFKTCYFSLIEKVPYDGISVKCNPNIDIISKFHPYSERGHQIVYAFLTGEVIDDRLIVQCSYLSDKINKLMKL